MTANAEPSAANRPSPGKRISALFNQQRYAAAMVIAEDACATAIGALGNQHPDVVQLQTNLGVISLKLGDKLRGELYLRRALEAQRQRAGDGSPQVGKIRDLLARVAGDQPLAGQNPEHIADLEARIRAESVELNCPACGRSYSVSPSVQGQRVECVDCGVEFQASSTATRGVVAVPPPPGPQPLQPAKPPRDATAVPEPAGNVVASDSLDYSFALSTPGWIRMDSATEAEYSADVALEHDTLGLFKVVISEWQLTFEDLCEGIEEAYKQETEQYRRITTSRTTVAGLPAICIEYEGVDPEQNQPLRFFAHAFLQDRTLFQVFAIGTPVTFNALKREALAALQSFSFDPAVAQRHRGTFPQRKSSWWRRLSSRPSTLPTDTYAILIQGAKWAIGGSVVGVLIGLDAMSGVSGFFGKLLILFLWIFAGAFVGAAFRWGQIGAFTSGGHLALDKLVQLACLPFHGIEFFLCMFTPAARGFARAITAVNRAVAFPIGFLSAGCPYMAYVLVTKQTRLGAGLYVVFAVVGGVLGLAGISLLMAIASLATPA